MAFFLTLIKVVVCCMLAGGCQSQEPGPAINDALDKVCSSLPADMQAKCTQFVGQYGSRVSANITHLTPEQACEQMGLCQSPAENKLASVILGSVVSGAKQMAAVTPPKLEKMPVDPAVKHCTLCELVLIKINPWLQKNATQVEMLDVMDKVCGILPSSIQKQCTQFVSQYGTQVIDNLLQLSPDQVCASLGLCEPAMGEADKTVSTIGKGDTSAGTDPVHQCILCNVVINKIDSLLVKQNLTEEEITAALDKVCSVLPPTIKDSCDHFVSQFGPMVLGLLETPDEICTKIGLCQIVTMTAVKPKKVKKKKKKPVDPALKHCTMCELVITKIEPLLEKNSTQAEIRGGMYKACAVLPPTMQPQCYPFISQYSAQILDNLIQFSPDQVCASLGLCINQTTSMVTDQAIKDHSSSDGLSSNKVDSSSGKDPSTDADPIHQCILCNVVINKIGSLLAKKNFTEEEVTAALDKVCSVLPPTIKDSCDNFVSQFGPMVLGLLENPEAVCTRISLCQPEIDPMKPAFSQAKLSSPESTPKFEATVPGPKQCALCEVIMSKIGQRILKNSSEADLVPAMLKVCDTLSPTIQTQCINFVNQYGIFIHKLDPEQVCAYLGVCEEVANNESSPSKEADPSGHQCVLCELIISKINTFLTKKNLTQEEMTAALDKVCSVLPPTIKDSCDNFVSQFGVLITDLLGNPDQVCAKMGLCIITPAETMKMSVPIAGPAGPKDCLLCEFIIAKLQELLPTNSTKVQAEEVPLTAASMTTAASGEEGDVQTTSAVEPTAPATAPREEDAPDTHLENGMISLVVLGVLFAIACSISLVVSVIRGEQQPGYRFRSGRRSLHGVRRYFPVAPPHSGCRAENHPLLTA